MAKTTRKAPDVIDVEPENPEVALATREGSQVQTFVAGLRVFFSTATTLEVAAKSTLARARQLTAPTNGEQDAAIQTFVRGANADRKVIEDHWEITSAIHRFHRRLTSARDRGVSPLEEAATIGTRLHASYVDAAKRRAREEDDRLRREAEDRARQERERELAMLEQKALAAEETSQDLSAREEAYLAEMVRTRGNGLAAAKFAGYKDPVAAATRLASSEKIRTALKARVDAEFLRTQIAAKRAAPVEVEHTAVEADVSTKGDRSGWSAELLDEQALIDAVIEGRHGIPRDILTVKPAKLNEYARALHELIDRWPGVRHKKTTTIV